MEQLAYSIIFRNENTHIGSSGSMQLELVINANSLGVTSARIYLDGSVPPAFGPLTNNRLATASNLAAGLYIVEFKDDNGQRVLGKLRLFTLATSCFNDAGTERGMVGYIQVSSTEFRVWSNVKPTTNASRSISIDGGVTWKATLNANAHIVWSSGELTALGVDRTIPNVIIKRTSNACTMTQAETVKLKYGYAPLTVSYSFTNCTAKNANDGTITITPSGGSGNQTYAWADGPVTQNRAGLAPGIYSVTITDTVTNEQVVLSNIQILEPQFAAPPDGTLLEFPELNDLQWVVDKIDPKLEPDKATLDNVLFADQFVTGFTKSCYFQKVIKADIRITQFNSDFSHHTAELKKYDTDELIKQFTIQLKESNLGVSQDFAISIRNHVNNPGKSRVYFTGNTGALPIPLSVGSVFEILNNLNGFNGSYSVVSIENDVIAGTQYIVITLNYNITATSSNATGRFLSNSADFNVFEFQHSYAEVAEGKYYIKVSAFNTVDLGQFVLAKVGQTEPIHLKEKWLGTTLIEYKNIDNDYGDITWTTGYVGKIRVDSIFGPKRMTSGGERSVSRNSNFDAVKTSAKKVRGVLFETYMLPPYLHEKLGLIFDCDYFSINKIAYQATEAYADPSYIEEFKLANSSIRLEQIGWNKRYNSNDIGTVAEGGFLLTEQGFIKL